MRVNTKQHPGFADDWVPIPSSELDILDEFIDWSSIASTLSLIKTDYQPLSLFKMMLLQSWHNQSDASISNAVSRDLVFMKFCGFSLEGAKPDSATLCRFRKQLVSKKLLDKLLLMVNRSMESKGLKLSHGKYVSADATLIQSARRPRKGLSSHKSNDGMYEVDEVVYSDDQDANWLKKGSQCVYGYSATVITDEDGLVEATQTHPANASEMTRFAEDIKAFRLKPGQKVLYDKGASSQANRDMLKEQKLKDGIMRKKPKGKAMPYWHKVRNRLISGKRFVTERTFGTMKRVYGLSRARYLGVEKVNGQVLIRSIAYNLKRAINLHLMQQGYYAQM